MKGGFNELSRTVFLVFVVSIHCLLLIYDILVAHGVRLPYIVYILPRLYYFVLLFLQCFAMFR